MRVAAGSMAGFLLLLGCLGAVQPPQGQGAGSISNSANVEFFEKRIRPLLVEHCHSCHSANATKLRGGLRLDSQAALLKGGDSGPAVVPGQPEKSRLIQAIGYEDVDLQMPPRGKLPAAAIRDLTEWVKRGASWASESAATVEGQEASFNLLKRKESHWAWQPIRRPPVPEVKSSGWPLEPADFFILAKLEKCGLSPSTAADRPTLIRRASFDLIGLPPSVEEVVAFVADTSPQAWEKVVDRLLASPHFGERWGRHWLDLVRYAETRGHEHDHPLPNAYQYRDYVIRAWNADLPYDQFVREHIAGDLLESPRLHSAEGFNESILATGFWLLGEEVHSPVDIRQDQADRFDNRIDVLTKTFLGMTVACARCHDHKYDAISARDYYALFGILEGSDYRLVRFDGWEQNRQTAANLAALRERERKRSQKALTADALPFVKRLADYLLAARGGGRKSAPDLDPIRLQALVRSLEQAAKDRGHLLHSWALLASEREEGEERPFAERLTAIRDRARPGSKPGPEDPVVIVDYRRASREDWRPDDLTFGTGPVRPGETKLDGDGVRWVEVQAAQFDPFWKELRAAPETQAEPGALGKQQRAGRTICTPAFEISRKKVHYLVKGKGLAYAAVDAHVLIAGPLHGGLVKEFASPDHFTWVEHDLSAYRGHRAHIEISAVPGQDLSLIQVVLSDTQPSTPELAPDIIGEWMSRTRPPGLEQAAAAVQKLVQEALERLESDRSLTSPHAADDARVANWLAGLHGGGASLSQAAAAWRQGELELARSARFDSRLALALHDGSGFDSRVFIRGSPKAMGESAPRRFLEALAGQAPMPISQGSGRRELAQIMTDPQRNPLLARVAVNRIWHHLFGRGIVASVDNFGVLGERPTHPELLDYLADEFVRDNWSLKRLIRRLVLSRTYQMSSRPGKDGGQVDPENRLLHRMPVRRLEGEAIRDALLAITGRLDRRLYGPPIPVHLTPFLEGRGRPGKSGPLDGGGRRSVYQSVRRNFLSSWMLAFDTPIPFSTVGRRTVSNVPAQSLILLNDDLVHLLAEEWARRLLEAEESDAARVERMFAQALGRRPAEEEKQHCLNFLRESLEPEAPLDAWRDLAHVFFNMKEMIFLP